MEMENEKREEQQHVQLTGLEENHDAPRVQIETEADLNDHHPEEADHHEQDDSDDEQDQKQDYHEFSKKQLVDVVKELSRDGDYRKVDRILREVKPVFDEIRDKEREEALKKFTDEGGVVEDFDYKGDEHDIAFDAHVKLIKDRKGQHIREQEDRKQDNLKRKEELLEKLRELVDSNDTNNQFEAFKELQKEWKSLGPVPAAHAKTLWATYHALVDRFYDNQSIYFELKELDRKRNLESKAELCVRAEKLQEVEIIKDAIRELNELHHEFKHIGPVPMDDKEAIWQRFKAASDAVYARRDAYMQNLQSELQENLDKKLSLAEEVVQYATYQSDRIKEWNQKTKEILDVQKRWEIIGGLPRAKAKEVNKKFWSAFKAFFNNKNAFFKKLDEEREQNLQAKTELVQRAQELKDSTDWETTSGELKSLQAKWKEVGPVPEKHREKIFQEFKQACDHFFEQRRSQHGRVEQDQQGNLEKKKAICNELEKHAEAGTATVDLLKELQDQFNEIGFVPKKELSAIRGQYSAAVEKFVASLPEISEEDKSRLLLENQLDTLKGDPNADTKIYHKEQAIRKKISKVENDIAVWRNNLEFFANSKSADKYRDEFNEKIEQATDHLRQLKQQLRLLRTVY